MHFLFLTIFSVLLNLDPYSSEVQWCLVKIDVKITFLFYFKGNLQFLEIIDRSSIGFNPISVLPIIMLIFLIIAWDTCWQNEVLLVLFQVDVGTHCCRIGAALDAAICRPCFTPCRGFMCFSQYAFQPPDTVCWLDPLT